MIAKTWGPFIASVMFAAEPWKKGQDRSSINTTNGALKIVLAALTFMGGVFFACVPKLSSFAELEVLKEIRDVRLSVDLIGLVEDFDMKVLPQEPGMPGPSEATAETYAVLRKAAVRSN